MAQEWCVAYGVLDDDEAIKVDKIICTRKGTKPSQIAKKSSSSASSTSAAVKEKVKKEAPVKKYKYADDLIIDTGKKNLNFLMIEIALSLHLVMTSFHWNKC